MPAANTVPKSPFFHPSTPHVVIVQQTPRGGTQRRVVKDSDADVVAEHKSGAAGAAANLVTAIVGAGIVGIPYAVRLSGFLAGLILILVTAVLTEKSLRLLISTAKHVHVPTYETAAEAAFGRTGFRFVAVNMLILSYGSMLSYLMIVKDSFSNILGVADDNVVMKRAVLVLISLSIMVPVSSQRDMADLAKTSRLNVVIDTALVTIVVFAAPWWQQLQDQGGLGQLIAGHMIHTDTVFVGLGVLSFAFVCQHSAFIIAGSLNQPTVKRWSAVTGSALSICLVLAMTCGVTGYLGFLEDTQGNILDNFESNSRAANVARGMLGCTMLFVYPLESFVARHVCVVLFFSGRRAHEGDDAAVLNRRDRRIGLTVLLYLAAVLPAAMFEDLGSVLALTGAVGGSCLSYIGPGSVFLGIHGGRFIELLEASWLGSMLTARTTDVAAATDKKPTLAVETTPLVASEREAAKIMKETEQKEESRHKMERSIAAAGKAIVWYLTGMPVWVWIAGRGKKGLTTHVHEMALKSPHPIRIGDVEYKRAAVTKSGRVEADPEEAAVLLNPKMLLRESSLPMLADGIDARPPKPEPLPLTPQKSKQRHTSIDQQIGKEILERQQKTALEKDPQEDPPSWLDFLIAIGYILFGIVALCAGLFSML